MSPAATSSSDPIDPERWEKLQALQQATGRDFLNEVIDLYLNDTPRRLADLRRALAEGDAHRAERLAHSMKGSSSNIGALRVQGTAAEVEKRCAGGALEGIDELVAELDAELARACEDLEERRPGP